MSAEDVEDVEAMTEAEIRIQLKRMVHQIGCQDQKVTEETRQLERMHQYADELRAELRRIYAAGEGENA